MDENSESIQTKSAQQEAFWRQMEGEMLPLIARVLEVDWPESAPQILALTSINPICPRFLNHLAFFLSYSIPHEQSAAVITHEISHFLYFAKWKQVFPKAKPHTFDNPYVEWNLSEILAPIILNDSRIQKILNIPQHLYVEHRKYAIADKPMFNHFTDHYNQHRVNKSTLADFLKTAYNDIQPLKKQLESM